MITLFEVVLVPLFDLLFEIYRPIFDLDSQQTLGHTPFRRAIMGVGTLIMRQMDPPPISYRGALTCQGKQQ